MTVPPSPPSQGPMLNYQPRPPRGPSYNKWWMISLRILGGLVAGGISGVMGAVLVGVTNLPVLFLLPPTLVFAALLVVCIKYRRFGYVTGFVLAPFLVIVGLIVTLAIICGTHP